jgi:hypothetical protein
MEKVKMDPSKGDDITNGSVVPGITHPVSISAFSGPAKYEFSSDLREVAGTRLTLPLAWGLGFV